MGWYRTAALLLASTLAASTPAAAGEVRVAAAADLTFALQALVERYQAEHGGRIKLSFGSSGKFTRQIEQGAPFDLFFSANEDYALRLVRAGLTAGEGRLYAVGRIVLFQPSSSHAEEPPELEQLGALAEAGRLKRLAIANPEHAPYGQAAEQALRSAGVWERVRRHLVLGENAAQATQFAASGAADFGIVPYAMVLNPNLQARGRYRLIPERLHAPLRQRVVLLRQPSAAALAFYQYLQGETARAVLARFGFAAAD